MKTISILAGYMLEVTTWENDGDQCKTQTFQGLQKNEVSFLVTLAKKFDKTYAWSGDGLPNEYQPEEVLREAIDECLALYPVGLSDAFREEWSNQETEVHELIYSLIGFPVDYEHGFCRVLDGFNVFYADKAIEISLTDSTKEFK